jgi:hypothetical protein
VVDKAWWAGKIFKYVVTVTREEDPTLGAIFTYEEPMLIQCRLHWADGTSALAHIFASMSLDSNALDSDRDGGP